MHFDVILCTLGTVAASQFRVGLNYEITVRTSRAFVVIALHR